MNKRKKEKYVKKEEEDVVIKKMSTMGKFTSLLSLAFISVACYFFLKYVLGQNTALVLSAISLAIIILGKILTARQYVESYAVFIISDIIGFCMWIEILVVSGFSIATISMLIYYLALFFNDVYGYSLWKAMYRKVALNGGFLFAKRKLSIKKIIKLRRQYRNLRWNREIDIAKNS